MPAMITSDLDVVLRELDAGRVVAIATDTVWGIAAKLDRPEAIASLFAVKQRPADVALPVLVASAQAALDLVGDLEPRALSLMENMWPGALTIVVDCRGEVARAIGAEHSVGLRMPNNAQLLSLLALTGPLATTSCNLHGEAPVNTAEAAADLLGSRGIVFDGVCGGEQSSTVVRVEANVVSMLRHGPVEVPGVE